MPQIRNPLNEVRVPFAKMSYTPDVPSTALGPNEYNSGLNVEADVRGIRSVAGDQAILDACPGTPTFITGGFRRGGEFWFIVATTQGRWYATNGKKYQYQPLPAATSMWYEITPGAAFTGYTPATNITEAWNGTVAFFSDGINQPMFFPDEAQTVAIPAAKIIQYSNVVPLTIKTIVAISATTKRIDFTTTQATAPFPIGSSVLVTGVTPQQLNGEWVVTNCTTTGVTITCNEPTPYLSGGEVAAKYTWNYNPDWKSVSANFLRLYNTPNVGSILVAGNLTAVNQSNTKEVYPVTVQWSQNFGLNEAPLTWTPTVTNVANQLEVPLRGPALDAFPCNGQFFLCSYWDTVVFSPINYSTTSAPILGVRLFNQGRGLLTPNCWANTDKLVYGVDARDVWVFDGQDFTGIGNQRVKNWFYDQLAPEDYDMVFMDVNSQKNQIEIYYPDRDATVVAGKRVPNKMLAYRYDIDCWNAPRSVNVATFSCESPIWTYSATPTPTWTANLGSRTIVYAQSIADQQLVQKDVGYDFLGQPITSTFRRDNIKLLQDYSGKLMVHRILPEAVNMGSIPFTSTDEIVIVPSPGSINVKVEGANSVGSAPASVTAITMNLDTNNPWCQVNQNSHRVNAIEIGNTSSTNIWMCSATTWQYTQVEDDR